MKRFGIVFLFLAVFGLAKIPFETRLTNELRAAHFHQAEFTRNRWDRVTQMQFVGALSGLRAMVADYLWIEAHSAWTRTEWGKMKLLFDAATTLQPRSVLFWEIASWHMAYNASVFAMRDPRQPREAVRLKARNEYYRVGENYLLRGIEFNPESAQLWVLLGQLYADKTKEHCKAAWAFGEAENRPGALAYVHREHAYELSRCPGHEREAYDLLVKYYKRSVDEHLPTLLKLIQQLQVQLDIPESERIQITPREIRESTPK